MGAVVNDAHRELDGGSFNASGGWTFGLGIVMLADHELPCSHWPSLDAGHATNPVAVYPARRFASRPKTTCTASGLCCHSS